MTGPRGAWPPRGNAIVKVRQYKTKWEAANGGAIPAGAIVFFRSGKGDVYENANEYYGWKTEEDAANRDLKRMTYPGSYELSSLYASICSYCTHV